MMRSRTIEDQVVLGEGERTLKVTVSSGPDRRPRDVVISKPSYETAVVLDAEDVERIAALLLEMRREVGDHRICCSDCGLADAGHHCDEEAEEHFDRIAPPREADAS